MKNKNQYSRLFSICAEQSGRSMIEMLGVLSIIGILSVGGFSMVKKTQNSYDTNKVMEEISSFVRKARTVLRQYDSTTDGNNMNNYLCKGKAVPDGITIGTTEVEGVATCNSFEGTAGITYSFADGSANKALFAMTISGLPEEICMQIATSDWGNSASSGFRGMKISTSSEIKTSMSLGDAANACADGVSIVMYFK